MPGDNFSFSTYKKEIICFRSNPEPPTLFCRDFFLFIVITTISLNYTRTLFFLVFFPFFDKTIKYTLSTYFEIIFIEDKIKIKMKKKINSPCLYLFIKNIYILGSSWGFFCPKNKKQTIFTFNKK